MNLKTVFQALFAVLLTFANCGAGDAVYFDMNGKPITAEQFNQIKQKRLEEKKIRKEKAQKALSSTNKSTAKPVNDANGKQIQPSKETQNKQAETKKEMEYDQYGRPIYDPEGNVITYSYWIFYKECLACGREVPLNIREGQRCPHCKAPWHWPEETKITRGGIKTE